MTLHSKKIKCKGSCIEGRTKPELSASRERTTYTNLRASSKEGRACWRSLMRRCTSRGGLGTSGNNLYAKRRLSSKQSQHRELGNFGFLSFQWISNSSQKEWSAKSKDKVRQFMNSRLWSFLRSKKLSRFSRSVETRSYLTSKTSPDFWQVQESKYYNTQSKASNAIVRLTHFELMNQIKLYKYF